MIYNTCLKHLITDRQNTNFHLYFISQAQKHQLMVATRSVTLPPYTKYTVFLVIYVIFLYFVFVYYPVIELCRSDIKKTIFT